MRAQLAAIFCATALCMTPHGADAQSTQQLTQQRDAVFQQLLEDPNDRDLMIRYAQLSVELREFEAAAATLERLVDQEPGNSVIRAELGIAMRWPNTTWAPPRPQAG